MRRRRALVAVRAGRGAADDRSRPCQVARRASRVEHRPRIRPVTRIDVTSDRAVVAVCDATMTLPTNADQNALVRELETMVGAGRVFYLITDDPVSYGIEISAGEPLAPPVDQEF